jgi:uncharacterized protein (TIGR00661 family)
MKILYAIQTTGNGHFTRSKEIISVLNKRVEVDVVYSGPKNKLLNIDNKVINHYKGLTLFYTKKGQINWIQTFFKNNFFRAIIDIIQCNTNAYDMIINDFEPITAWSCYLKNRKCVSLSNQYAILSDKKFLKSTKYRFTLLFLRYFAPTKEGYGFHLTKRKKNIFHPVVREELKKTNVVVKDFYLVYLPNYSIEKLIQFFTHFKSYKWRIFSPLVENSYTFKNIKFEQINEKKFIKALLSSKGVISSSGFSTLSEALYLSKPLITIPINSHFEQIYNSSIIEKLGGTVLDELSLKNKQKLQKWLDDLAPVGLKNSQDSIDVVDRILIDYIRSLYFNKNPINQFN